MGLRKFSTILFGSLLGAMMPFSAVAGEKSGIGRCYMAAEGVAVFEPLGYDASKHSPSPIFIKALEDMGGISPDWRLRPVFRKSGGRTSASIAFGDADLYGTGEVSGSLRRNDDSQNFWNTDNPTAFLFKGKQLYQSHPWVMGVREDGSTFGIIADNTWRSSLSTKGNIVFKSEGPAFRIIIIEKENPEQMIRTLAELTGRMELPPIWALGYQQCRYSYYPQERVAGLADTLRDHRIPCDVIWMDIHYMDKYKVFTFDKERFPDPKGLNDYLHGKNLKTVYMIDPGIKAEEGYFIDDQGRAGDYFVKDKKGAAFLGKVWPGQCHFPDFTMPEVRQWWAGLYKDFMSNGIDGVWNDMNEPSIFSDFGGTMPPSNRHRGGNGIAPDSHLRYHNIYGSLMVKASREGLLQANPDKRPFILSRSNFLGGQRYAAMWTGDNYSDYAPMKESVPMCLNIGLSGQPFNGPDIGGFMNDCSADLLCHWTAFGVFFPFVRNHSSIGTANQEPWAFGKEAEDVCRTAIQRRYRLLPYYYTLFEEASRTGLPIMRPVFWADFSDTALRDEQQAFLVGNDLLVIPRWSENPKLPKGSWELFDFGEDEDGYQAYMALRPGAAVPVIDVVQSTVEYGPGTALSVIVNPDSTGRASGELYEDAGDGFGYRNGEFARYSLDAILKDNVLTLTVKRTQGGMQEGGRPVRVGLVRGGRITWSEWSESGSVTMDDPGLASVPADAEALQFTPVADGSNSQKLTKMKLILMNIVK